MNKRIKNKIRKSVKKEHYIYSVHAYDNTLNYSFNRDEKENDIKEKNTPKYHFFFKKEDSAKKFRDFANMLENEKTNNNPIYIHYYIEHKLLN